MARPKSRFTRELTERIQDDLKRLNLIERRNLVKVAVKLSAIIAATKHPVETVAKIFDVKPVTLRRWGDAYEKNGMKGLYPKSKKPKPSKLTPEQQAEVISWVKAKKTADGKGVPWTHEKLREAISDRFGVTLGINTIWTWLGNEGIPDLKRYR